MTHQNEDFEGYEGATELSEGWSSYSSNRYPGKIYYFNSRTGKRQWDFPSELYCSSSPSASGSTTDDREEHPSTPSLSGSILDAEKPRLNTNLSLLNEGLFEDDPDMVWKLEPFPIKQNLDAFNKPIPYAATILAHYQQNYMLHSECVSGTIISHDNVDTHSESEKPSDYIETSSETITNSSNWSSQNNILECSISRELSAGNPSEVVRTDELSPTKRRKLNRSAPVISPENIGSTNLHFDITKIPLTDKSLSLTLSPSSTAASMSSFNSASIASPSTKNRQTRSISGTRSSCFSTVEQNMTKLNKLIGSNSDDTDLKAGPSSVASPVNNKRKTISTGTAYPNPETDQRPPCKRPKYEETRSEEQETEERLQFNNKNNNNKQMTNINTGTCKAANRLQALQEKLAKNQLLDALIKSTSNNNEKIIENEQNVKSQCVANGSHPSAVPIPRPAFRRQVTAQAEVPYAEIKEKPIERFTVSRDDPPATGQRPQIVVDERPHNHRLSSPRIPRTDSSVNIQLTVPRNVSEEDPAHRSEPPRIPSTNLLGTFVPTQDRSKGSTRAANRLDALRRNLQLNQANALDLDQQQRSLVTNVKSPASSAHTANLVASRGSSTANSVASRGSSTANSVGSRGSHLANSVGSRGSHLANSAGSRGSHLANSVGSRGSHLANSVGSRGSHLANSVGSRGSHLANSAGRRGSRSASPPTGSVQSSRGVEVSLNSVGSCNSLGSRNSCASRASVDSRNSGGSHSSASSRSIAHSRNYPSPGRTSDPFTPRPTFNSNYKYNGPAKLPLPRPATVVREPSTEEMLMEDEEYRPESVDMDWEPSETEQMTMITDVNIVRKTLGYQDLYPRTDGDDNLIRIGQMKASYFIVLDSNILMGHLKFVEHLRDHQYTALEPLVLVVPWAVVQELDKLKDGRHDSANFDRESLSKQQARLAVSWLNQQFSNKHPRVKGQTSFDLSAVQFHCKVADDCILKCCLQMAPFANHVVLLTNDKNLRNKASMMEVQAKSREELQLALSKFKPTSVATPRTDVDTTRQRNALDDPVNQDAAQADGILCRLQPVLLSVLGNVLEKELVHAFGNMWTSIVRVKPPWLVLRDVIENYVHHWISIASEVFPNSAKLHFKELNTFFNSKLSKSYNHSLAEVRSIVDASLAICRHIPRDMLTDDDGNFMQKLQDLKQSCGVQQPAVAKASNPTTTSLVTLPTAQDHDDDDVRYKTEFALIKKPLEIIWEILNRFCVNACDFLQIEHRLARYSEPSDQLTVDYIREGLYNITPIYQSLMASFNTVMNVPADQLYSNEEVHPAIVQFHSTLTQTHLGNNQDCLDDLPSYYILYKFCVSKTNRAILLASLNQFNDFGHCLGLVLQEVNRQFPVASKPVLSYMTE